MYKELIVVIKIKSKYILCSLMRKMDLLVGKYVKY